MLDAPLYPGDPLTPGVGATKDAKRLKLEDAQSIAKVPVLPISYADANRCLLLSKVRLRQRIGVEHCRSRIASDPVRPRFI